MDEKKTTILHGMFNLKVYFFLFLALFFLVVYVFFCQHIFCCQRTFFLLSMDFFVVVRVSVELGLGLS